MRSLLIAISFSLASISHANVEMNSTTDRPGEITKLTVHLSDQMRPSASNAIKVLVVFETEIPDRDSTCPEVFQEYSNLMKPTGLSDLEYIALDKCLIRFDDHSARQFETQTLVTAQGPQQIQQMKTYLQRVSGKPFHQIKIPVVELTTIDFAYIVRSGLFDPKDSSKPWTIVDEMKSSTHTIETVSDLWNEFGLSSTALSWKDPKDFLNFVFDIFGASEEKRFSEIVMPNVNYINIRFFLKMNPIHTSTPSYLFDFWFTPMRLCDNESNGRCL